MILIWRGWGIAIPFITMLITVLMQLVVDGVIGDDSYFKSHSWLMLLSMVFAATAVWMIGNKLDQQPGRVVIDKESGQQFELKSKHDLFWIPFKWWAVPLVLIGALLGAS